MGATMSKAALLEQIERERESWERLLAEVGPERMEQPGFTSSWTFKDFVAHMNGWRTHTVDRIEAGRANTDLAPPPWPADLNEDDEDGLKQINAWIERTGRERSLQQVLDESRRQFDQLRDGVAALPEEVLTEPGRFPWMRGEPLGAIVGYSFGHFHEEHEADVRAWLGRIGVSA